MLVASKELGIMDDLQMNNIVSGIGKGCIVCTQNPNVIKDACIAMAEQIGYLNRALKIGK